MICSYYIWLDRGASEYPNVAFEIAKEVISDQLVKVGAQGKGEAKVDFSEDPCPGDCPDDVVKVMRVSQECEIL